MQRKLIRQGGGGLTLYLPKKWVDENELRAGDTVEIQDHDTSLTVTMPFDRKRLPATTTVDVSEMNERSLRNVLNSAYRKGYDKMVLTVQKQQIKIIRELTRETLLGFEIIEEGENNCVVQNIVEPAGEKYDVMLRKVFLLTKQEAEELFHTDMKKSDETKNSVDKYTNFVRRIIINERIPTPRDSYLLFHMVSLLSLINHAYYYMKKHIVEKKVKKVSAKTNELVKETNDLFDTFYQAFYKNDLELAHSIQVRKKEIIDRIHALQVKTAGPEATVLYHLGEIVRLTQIASTNVFGFYQKQFSQTEN